MPDQGLQIAITTNVRDALNGDTEACKKLSLLIQLPFSSIEGLYGTSEEDYYALNMLASIRFRHFNDKSAFTFLTSAKNPLRNVFAEIVGLLKV